MFQYPPEPPNQNNNQNHHISPPLPLKANYIHIVPVSAHAASPDEHEHQHERECEHEPYIRPKYKTLLCSIPIRKPSPAQSSNQAIQSLVVSYPGHSYRTPAIHHHTSMALCYLWYLSA
ncbi:hypothetical protein BDQ94DRAFT_43435 [Aspergillus welwitschiae]|uniref:Uncharacterized protein n=1 Tax=Aspergillus welwitschiae TaxID=1341132 RepID=A0A3F3QGE9_9EURO|nr:hypothetical protein BDQ94DRAFT_43435 [Aspergillus welwitschiae]RDH38348.1 hypothetical protein BDQ94DRAFT_43435 [Aspergillus welwitschiae]